MKKIFDLIMKLIKFAIGSEIESAKSIVKFYAYGGLTIIILFITLILSILYYIIF